VRKTRSNPEVIRKKGRQEACSGVLPVDSYLFQSINKLKIASGVNALNTPGVDVWGCCYLRVLSLIEEGGLDAHPIRLLQPAIHR
jgi:hypothetical protein